MKTSYSTIDEYINSYSSEVKEKLNTLREIILKAAPSGTKETISYNMPTFRWNGNLIHFAQNKNHIGIYPGAQAIIELAKDLENYKTTKGCIQIPNQSPLPTHLIEKIVVFNTNILQDKIGPTWDTYKANWQECEDFMNSLIVKTNLTKTFKWGSDVFTYKGKNVIGWGGFKNFFSLWFYNGVFLADNDKVLISASEGKTKALRQWRFTDCSQMNEQKILEYIQESIKTIEDGKTLVIEKKADIIKPEGILYTVLEQHETLKESFFKLTPGRQKEYIEYINEAKQEKTKISRIEKIKPLILSHKGLNDKYK